MAHESRVLHILELVGGGVVAGEVCVHVNEPEKIETQWRRQSTQKHANKEERIVIGLVIWRNEVNVEELIQCYNLTMVNTNPDLNLEEGRVGAVAQVANDKNAKYLQIGIIVFVTCILDNQRKNRQRAFLHPKRTLAPHDHGGENAEQDRNSLHRVWTKETPPPPFCRKRHPEPWVLAWRKCLSNSSVTKQTSSSSSSRFWQANWDSWSHPRRRAHGVETVKIASKIRFLLTFRKSKVYLGSLGPLHWLVQALM